MWLNKSKNYDECLFKIDSNLSKKIMIGDCRLGLFVKVAKNGYFFLELTFLVNKKSNHKKSK